MTALWPHQEEGVTKVEQAIAEYGGGALFWEMAAGKTVGALEVMRRLGARRVLVVGPINTLMDGVDSRGRELNVWRRDVPLVFGGPHVPVTLLSGTTAQKAAQVATVSDGIYCVNWESFWREPLLKKLKDQKFDLIIADEVHRAANGRSKASRHLAELGQTAGARLGLSGTPLPHDPIQAWAVYRFVAPAIFAKAVLPGSVQCHHEYELR